MSEHEVTRVDIVETEIVVREKRRVRLTLVGRIVWHSSDWKRVDLDSSAIALELGDTIVVRYHPDAAPRLGSVDVFAHLDNNVWLVESAWWCIPALADMDYVYRVDREVA